MNYLSMIWYGDNNFIVTQYKKGSKDGFDDARRSNEKKIDKVAMVIYTTFLFLLSFQKCTSHLLRPFQKEKKNGNDWNTFYLFL